MPIGARVKVLNRASHSELLCPINLQYIKLILLLTTFRNTMKKALLILSLLFSFSALANIPYNTNSTFFKKSDKVIGGYDVVSYFEQGEPAKGSDEFAHEWQGAKWLFRSQENKDLFVVNPEKYAPQYGGYCAWAVAHENDAPIDPDQWTIIDDKLYLNYNAKIQKKWNKDKPGYIEKANVYWPSVQEDLLDE